MALDINISSYVSGGYTNPILWRLYETGSGVLVDEHTEAGPHGVSYQFSFVDNIIDIVYTINMYEVVSGTPNFIKGMDITVSTSTIVIDADIELIVDGGESYDPVNGATSVTVPATIGRRVNLFNVALVSSEKHGHRNIRIIQLPVNLSCLEVLHLMLMILTSLKLLRFILLMHPERYSRHRTLKQLP